MSKPAYFISDLHLGAQYRKAYPDREMLLHRLLDQVASQGSHLFILGDLFEFWMEYRSFIPKGHFRTLAALERLASRGVEVHYLSGNHDFNLGGFFREHLGVTVHAGPLEVTLQVKIQIHSVQWRKAYYIGKITQRERWDYILKKCMFPR